jgi:chemotaxis protein methyltransferase CheR
VTPLDYDYLRKCLKQRSGLVLSADKQYLVESRLLPVARKAGLANLGELVAALKAAPEHALMTAVVEAMTTNESFFFRDKVPFDHFRDTIIPALLAARKGSRFIRIWCAAASTGQEPYSLAMCLKQMESEIAGWRIEIVATDLSRGFGESAGRPLQPVRSAARAADPAPDQAFLANRRAVADRAGHPRHGQIPPAQPAAGFLAARAVRPGLLPQRADLFRPGDQDRCAQPAGALDGGYLVLGAAETGVGLTDGYRTLADKRGLYAVNTGAPRLSIAGAAKSAPRLVAINCGR